MHVRGNALTWYEIRRDRANFNSNHDRGSRSGCPGLAGDCDIGKGTYMYVPLWSKYYLYSIMLTTLCYAEMCSYILHAVVSPE